MVGTMMTATPTPRAIVGAADAAIVLLAAHDKPDNALIKRLENLKAVAEHNQDIYDQTSEALQDLSIREAQVKRMDSDARATLAVARAAEATNSAANQKATQEIAAARATLKREREAFEEERRLHTAESNGWEAALTAAKAENEAASATNQNTATKLTVRATELGVRESRINKFATDLKALLARNSI